MKNGTAQNSLTTLSDILGYDSRAFRDEVFGRRPLHVPGANERAYRDLVTLEEIDGILSSPSTRPPHIRLIENGDMADPRRFTFSATVGRRQVDGLLDHRLLMERFHRGGTIVLDSIQHWLPAVRDLFRSLQEELGADGRATVFASPPNEQALEPHADSYEIFVLQLAGAKEWSLYRRLDPVPRAGARLSGKDLGPEEETVVLNPGDLLYVPWGTPHRVRSLDAASVHVSISVRPPTWGDVLEGLLRELVKDGREHEPALMSRGREDELAKELFARLSRITEGLGEVSAPAYAARLIANATEQRCGASGLTLSGLCAEPADEKAVNR